MALLDIITVVYAACKAQAWSLGMEVNVTVVPRERKGIKLLVWERQSGETSVASHRHPE